MHPHLSSHEMKRLIGERLRATRVQKNEKQENVAAANGMSKSKLSKIENGTYRLHMDELNMLTTYYDIDISELIKITTDQ